MKKIRSEKDINPEDILGAISYPDIDGIEGKMLKTLFPNNKYPADIDLVTDLPDNAPAILSLFELYAEREGLDDLLEFSKKLKRLMVSKDRKGREEALRMVIWNLEQQRKGKEEQNIEEIAK